MPSTALILSPESLAGTYPPNVLDRLRAVAGDPLVIAPAQRWREHVAALRDVEVLFSGWGAPTMDAEFLRHLPRLKAVFYAGGSVRYFITPEVWNRGIRVCTAQAVNAVPVAEFTQALVQLSLKRFWHYAQLTRRTHGFPSERPMPGAYGSTVGLVSYGTIGRLVHERLRQLEVTVLVHDPHLPADEARRAGLRGVDLDELFGASDVVSVHTPLLPETRGLIRGRHLERMRPGSTFINTARGEVVDEPEMLAVLQRRPDLVALLDVTAPEPPAPDSPLYALPNVVLTPHIAGSVGRECERMSLAMIAEYERYRRGEVLVSEITAARAALIA